jgi:hypothetical protein
MRLALVLVGGALLFGGAAQARTPGSADALLARLARGGVVCQAPRAFPPRSAEREERRCHDFALATFTSAERRAAWVDARARESWFSATRIVYGRRWALWTASADTGARASHILHGRVFPLALPQPVVRIEKCREGPPARPTPISPSGPMYSYKRETWGTEETDTCAGLTIVAATPPGTSALTGVVESTGARGALSGVVATLQSVDVNGVPDAASKSMRTVTDRQGGYSFADFPTAGDGSCYLLTVDAERFGREEYRGFFEPGQQYQQTLDMDFAQVDDGDEPCFPEP